MNPRKKGNQYEIVYRCPGFQKPFCERFETLEEANLRIAQIEEQKKLGNLKPSSKLLYGKNYRAPNRQITVRELMEGLSDKDKHRVHYMSPGKDRGKLRSKTYEGIAKAMAEQWSI